MTKGKRITTGVMAVLAIGLLTGCGNAGSTGNSLNADRSNENVVSGMENIENTKKETENDSSSGEYADEWVGKLKPTGQNAAEYPFEQLGTVKGYLPGMMPDEVKDYTEVEGREFTTFFVNGDENKACEYLEESDEVTRPDAIKVCVKNSNPDSSFDETAAYYAIYSPFEQGEKYTVRDALENGTYQVIVEAPSGGYLSSSVFGFTDSEGNDIDGAELLDAVIDKWGMPSYIYMEVVSGYPYPWICYECDDYIVLMHVMCMGSNKARLTSIHVFEPRYRERMEQYVGTDVKWEP